MKIIICEFVHCKITHVRFFLKMLSFFYSSFWLRFRKTTVTACLCEENDTIDNKQAK